MDRWKLWGRSLAEYQKRNLVGYGSKWLDSPNEPTRYANFEVLWYYIPSKWWTWRLTQEKQLSKWWSLWMFQTEADHHHRPTRGKVRMKHWYQQKMLARVCSNFTLEFGDTSFGNSLVREYLQVETAEAPPEVPVDEAAWKGKCQFWGWK